tara:strand:+ start:440 stop:556 length:117 start_codon:yes stop_codon:yes gene_type:complete
MKIVKSIKAEVVGKDNQIKESASLTDIKRLLERIKKFK